MAALAKTDKEKLNEYLSTFDHDSLIEWGRAWYYTVERGTEEEKLPFDQLQARHKSEWSIFMDEMHGLFLLTENLKMCRDEEDDLGETYEGVRAFGDDFTDVFHSMIDEYRSSEDVDEELLFVRFLISGLLSENNDQVHHQEGGSWYRKWYQHRRSKSVHKLVCRDTAVVVMAVLSEMQKARHFEVSVI